MNKNNQSLALNGKNGGLAFTLFICAYILITFIGQMVCSLAFEQSTFWYTVIGSTFSATALFCIIIFTTKYTKINFRQITLTEKAGGVYILLGLLLSVGMFFGLGFANNVIAQVLAKLGLKTNGISLSINGFGEFVVYCITFALLPAVFEELFFRGILLKSLSNAGKVSAVLLTSLSFALYHCSAVQFLYQFLFGIAFAVLAICSKSTIPCVITHFVNNFVVLLLTYLNINVNLLNPLTLVLGINALAFYCTIVFFVLKKSKKAQKQKNQVALFSAFASAGWVLCLILLISALFG